MQVRQDITVVMVAPSPGTEVREEYARFCVPTRLQFILKMILKARAGILRRHGRCNRWTSCWLFESSFVAEVKPDLMGEQTILCGMLQAGSIVSYEKMVIEGIDPGYAVNYSIRLGDHYRST